MIRQYLFLVALLVTFVLAGRGFGADAATQETGFIFNRGQQQQPADPNCPDGKCPVPNQRTQPVTPESALLFESIPPAAEKPAGSVSQSGSAPAVAAATPTVVVSDPLYTTPTALTPEQKEALKGLIVQVATLLIGAFMGSGAASPFMALILEKLLGAVKGGTATAPDVPKPARTRRRASRAKKKAAPKQ